MEPQHIEKLRYPIGTFRQPSFIDRQHIDQWIQIIEAFPGKIKKEVDNLSAQELKKRYRPGGWTISQLVHHCADSHMNSFIRFKLALTEDTPVIKPYAENLWASLPDAKNYPIDSSLKIIEGVHARWAELLKSLSEDDLQKEFHHPESKENISLKTNIGLYAWHCEHHLAHIIMARQNQDGIHQP